jgi:hypothetical protein
LEVLYQEYGDCFANYYDLIACYRWLLEGLGLYVQLDFAFSREFEAASEIFFFAEELLNSEFTRSAEGAPRPDSTTFMDEARESKYASGLLKLVLGSTGSETASYLLGYLSVKEIQRSLSMKDVRLRDPEVFFIFLHSYFFNDQKLVNLCRIGPREGYRDTVSSFIAESINDLLNARPENLREAVNAIADYSNAEVNYAWLDFRVAITEGKMKTWAAQDSLTQCEINLVSYADALEGQALFHGYRDSTSFQSEATQAVELSIFLFHTLRNAMLAFKLKHTPRAILGYQVFDDDVSVASVSLLGTPFTPRESIPLEVFRPIINEAQAGDFVIQQNDPERLLPPEFMDALMGVGSFSNRFGELLHKHYLAKRLLIVQEYDTYVLSDRIRYRIWIRDGFLRMEPFLENKSGQAEFRSAEYPEILEQIGHSFHHDAYLQLIRFPKLTGGPGVEPSTEFEISSLLTLWRLLFPQSKASEKEFRVFATQKAKVIAVTPAERLLLQSLSAAQSVDVTDQLANVQAINRRWRHLVGRDLIATTNENAIWFGTLDL